ncbi:MAG: sigma-70 family RNA polymerase sigma factor [Clostridia bacterium]|nr:sigma-70 family RNA polymerase sigma factor [Clostridia bacterium]
MEKNTFNRIDDAIEKFNSFINTTIFLSAKDYFRKEVKKEEREVSIINDENFEKYLESFLEYEEEFEKAQYPKDIIEFINMCENNELHIALKSLSSIEQSVIFLLFSEELSQEEASKILKICSKSVSRIKLRAVEKLKNMLKGSD